MKIKLNIMSRKSVEDAIADVEKYKAKVQKLSEELPKVLADYGMVGASTRFNASIYDVLWSGLPRNNANISVSAEPTDNGWRVLAHGDEVCYIEFGAGVYFNGAESYLGTRPPGIDGIGQHGDMGRQTLWGFYDGDDVVLTHGTPAQNCMYYTAQEIRGRIAETARSILNGND